MFTCEQLLQEINRVKDELLQQSYTLECLTDPILVKKSQELDILITLYQAREISNVYKS
jgi:Spo0E like sporulation regulatory protein